MKMCITLKYVHNISCSYIIWTDPLIEYNGAPTDPHGGGGGSLLEWQFPGGKVEEVIKII